MLKGVNHKVIEVCHPDSLYFERAVFYLRPEVDDLPTHAALCESERYLGVHALHGKRQARWLWFLTGAASAAAVCAVLYGVLSRG